MGGRAPGGPGGGGIGRPVALVGGTRRGGGGIARPEPDTGGRGGIGRRGGAASVAPALAFSSVTPLVDGACAAGDSITGGAGRTAGAAAGALSGAGREEITRRAGTGASSGASMSPALFRDRGAAAFLAADAFLAGAFFAGSGSSGCTARRRPSASALRRTRSAWASSMEDE